MRSIYIYRDILESLFIDGNLAEWLLRMTRNHIPSGAHVRIMRLSKSTPSDEFIFAPLIVHVHVLNFVPVHMAHT